MFTLDKCTSVYVTGADNFPLRSPKWLGTLRPVTSAKSEMIHLDMLVTVLCGDCLVRVVETVL